MTEIVLVMGTTVYTELSVPEVRSLLQGGSKTGSLRAYLDAPKTQPIELAVHDIGYIKLF